MDPKERTYEYNDKLRFHVSKSLNIVKAWNFLGPIVVEKIAGPEYSHVPYLLDTDAYKIGHIFVQEPTKIRCFCASPMCKVIGPIRDFIKLEESDSRWSSADLNAIKSTDDYVNFIVLESHFYRERKNLAIRLLFQTLHLPSMELKNGRNIMRFRAYDYFFLDKGTDMPIEEHVTIDRSSHEDLSRVEWFGLITGVVAAHAWDIYLVRDERERTLYVGDKPHTILFKYEICRMDEKGIVHETSGKKMVCKWQPVQEGNLDELSLNNFVTPGCRKRK